jgi:hypothetical protein
LRVDFFWNSTRQIASIRVDPIAHISWGVNGCVVLFSSDQPWIDVSTVIAFSTPNCNAEYHRRVLAGGNAAIWQTEVLNQGSLSAISRLIMAATVFFVEK